MTIEATLKSTNVNHQMAGLAVAGAVCAGGLLYLIYQQGKRIIECTDAIRSLRSTNQAQAEKIEDIGNQVRELSRKVAVLEEKVTPLSALPTRQEAVERIVSSQLSTLETFGSRVDGLENRVRGQLQDLGILQQSVNDITSRQQEVETGLSIQSATLGSRVDEIGNLVQGQGRDLRRLVQSVNDITSRQRDVESSQSSNLETIGSRVDGLENLVQRQGRDLRSLVQSVNHITSRQQDVQRDLSIQSVTLRVLNARPNPVVPSIQEQQLNLNNSTALQSLTSTPPVVGVLQSIGEGGSNATLPRLNGNLGMPFPGGVLFNLLQSQNTSNRGFGASYQPPSGVGTLLSSPLPLTVGDSETSNSSQERNLSLVATDTAMMAVRRGTFRRFFK
jgi:cell division protein FtsL